jgi:hypothetical protein
MGIKSFNVMALSKAGLADPRQVGYRDSIEIIKDELFKTQRSFVKIGWYLKHIREEELYKEGGYQNIWECASDLFSLTQSTASRFMKICEKFSENNDSPELDKRYEGFDKSQMIEMLPLNQEQMKQISPDMTEKQIRQMKESSHKETEVQKETHIPGQTSIEKDFPEYLPDDRDEKSVGKETIVDGEYTELKESVEHEEPPEAELPMLKNSNQCKDWLNRYKAWGMWYRDENIDVNYYKYDFPDGSRLVVAEYPQRFNFCMKPQDEHYYHLIEKKKEGRLHDGSYHHHADNESDLVEFLKRQQTGK